MTHWDAPMPLTVLDKSSAAYGRRWHTKASPWCGGHATRIRLEESETAASFPFSDIRLRAASDAVSLPPVMLVDYQRTVEPPRRARATPAHDPGTRPTPS